LLCRDGTEDGAAVAASIHAKAPDNRRGGRVNVKDMEGHAYDSARPPTDGRPAPAQPEFEATGWPSRIAMPTFPDTVEEDISLAASVDLPVLIVSARRERRRLCAHRIHLGGSRAFAPFITSPVGAGTGQRAVSGVARGDGPADDEGATGFRQRFGHARGGTLFIDDIAVIDSRVRDELLSLLEDDASPRERGSPARRSDVRVIAGASRSLTAERATDAAFARLFYRLNIVTIALID
jgi:DNA-binding NtrC family response regulator